MARVSQDIISYLGYFDKITDQLVQFADVTGMLQTERILTNFIGIDYKNLRTKPFAWSSFPVKLDSS